MPWENFCAQVVHAHVNGSRVKGVRPNPDVKTVATKMSSANVFLFISQHL